MDPSYDLETLHDAAIAFDDGQEIADAAMHRLYAAGSTPGGARPKALVNFDGQQWIAKFPSPTRDRGFDVVGLEATCLALAGDAGLTVPESRLITLGARRAVLVRRFDVMPSGGRCHMISLSTLCRETGGVFCTSYGIPAAVVRKFSDDPDDLARFFRQAAFNVATGNTDDHLKNFVMLRDAAGYRLSPAFDLIPNVGQNPRHVMAIGYQATTPSGGDLVAVGRQWLGTEASARRIAREVTEAVAGFRIRAEALKLAPGSIETFAKDIDRRLGVLHRGL